MEMDILIQSGTYSLKDQESQNSSLHFWAGCCECNEFFDFLKLFEDVDMDCSFPMRQYTLRLDSCFKSYEVLKF
jgi:hypothetical protein